MFKIKSLTSCKTIEFDLTHEMNQKIITIAFVMIGMGKGRSLKRMLRNTQDVDCFGCKNYSTFDVINECCNSMVFNNFRSSGIVSLLWGILPVPDLFCLIIASTQRTFMRIKTNDFFVSLYYK